MDTSYHLGWQTGNCDLFKKENALNVCQEFTRTLPLNVHLVQSAPKRAHANKRHTRSSEGAKADGRWKGSKGRSFWIIVVCVVIVVPYVQVGYLSSFPNHAWRRDPVVCNRFQNGLESFRSGARAARLRAHWGVFDKVLCIKVTITFITDVVYIFDILMFILFCERREYI